VLEGLTGPRLFFSPGPQSGPGGVCRSLLPSLSIAVVATAPEALDVLRDEFGWTQKSSAIE